MGQYAGAGMNALRGGYVIADMPKPDVILIGCGSELDLCMEARELLAKEGIRSRVVSMPCIEEFEAQTAEYKELVLPSAVKARVCVEAASPYSWYKYAGDCGEVVAMPTFGASGPYELLYEHFGFTKENVVKAAKKSIQSAKTRK